MRRLSCFKSITKAFLFQWAFVLSAFLFLLACLVGPAVELPGSEKTYSLLNMFMDASLYRAGVSEQINSGYRIAYMFDSSKWFVILLPVLASIPVLNSYDRINRSIKIFMLSRMNRKAYCRNMLAAAFVTGAAVVIIGVFLYSIVVNIVFANIKTDDPLVESYLLGFGKDSWQRFIYLVKKISNHALAGGLYASTTLLIYHLVRDKFLTLTLPMVLMYISDKLYMLYEKTLFEDITDIKPNKLFALFPSNITMCHYMFESEYGISYFWFFVFATCLLIVLALVYIKIFDKMEAH